MIKRPPETGELDLRVGCQTVVKPARQNGFDRRGRYLITCVIYPSRSDGSDDGCSLDDAVAPHVDTDELTDAQGVADILGVAYRNTVSVYQRRYPDMPRPVVDLGVGRPRLWLRPEIEAWAERRSAGGRRGK